MPDADLQPGRWRCLLCAAPVWTPGTLHDLFEHYDREHRED